MKLVITTDCFLPRWDGVARFLSELIPVLSKTMDITVFCPDFGIQPFKRVRVVRFPLVNYQFGDIRFCLPDSEKMEECIKRADVVFNQTIGPVGMAGIRIASKLNKPIVSYVHSIDWELAGKAMKYGGRAIEWSVKHLARWLYNKCSLLLVSSSQVSDLLSQDGIRTKKEIVRMGVSVSRFVPPKSKVLAKKKINLSNKFVVGFVGRIAREKSLPTLYSAFERLHSKFSKSVLLLVGTGLDVPKNKNIVHVGGQDDVLPFLQAMDVFVLPSLTETSSLSTMEAMSCAVPVVVTPVGNIREYVVDKKTGLLFSRKDVSGLYDNLFYLFKNSKARKSLGLAGRAVIVKDYSWDVCADKIKKILLTFSS